VNKGERIEGWLLLLYAASLPLSMTASWVLYIAGLSWTIVHRILLGSRFSELSKAPLAVPLLVFVSAVFVSGTLNGGIREGIQSIWSLKALGVYPWAFLVFYKQPALVFRVASAVLSVAAIAGVWGTIQQLTGWHPAGYPYLQGTGFLGGPMAFAGQMQLFSLLALGLLMSGGRQQLVKPLNNLTVFSAITVANCSGAFFASERSAWLGLLAGILAIALMRSWKVLCGAMLALSGLGVCSWFAIPVVQTRLLPLLNWQNDISVKVRLFLWSQAIEHWKAHPWFGLGIRRFPHYDISEAIVPGKSIDINHAHSNIFHLGTTIGVVGLLSYLWIMVAAAIASIAEIRRKTQYSSIALGVFGGIIALFVSGLFEYNFGTSQVRLAQWLILAMLLPSNAAAATAIVSEPVRAVEENPVT
jgi:O-antigen ligase